MTIEHIMLLASVAQTARDWAEVRAAIVALLDAEAEACAELCDKERAAALEVGMSDGAAPTKRAVYATAAAWAATCRDSIRARIAARKGGNDD
jgi:hypothetical protein